MKIKFSPTILNDLKGSITEDDDYLYVPFVGTTEGVQNGAYKSKAELAKTYRWLKNRPVTLLHPDGPAGPGVAHGTITDVWFDGTSVGGVAGLFKNEAMMVESGFAPDDIPIHRRILDSFRNGADVEISVGFLAWVVEESGDFNGVPYERIEKDIMYDHLAMVPTGACDAEVCGMGTDKAVTIKNGQIRERLMRFLKFLGVRMEDLNEIESSSSIPNDDDQMQETETNGEEIMTNEQDFEGYVQAASLRFLADHNEEVARTMKEHDEYAKKIGELQERYAKASGEADESLAEMQEKLRVAQERIGELEAAGREAEAQERADVVSAIVAQNGKEAEVYENWSLDQLVELRENLLSLPSQSDRSALLRSRRENVENADDKVVADTTGADLYLSNSPGRK